MASYGVFLLNSTFTILGNIDPERAFSLIATNKAWILLSIPGKFVQSPSLSFAWPTHVVLNNWVNVPHYASKFNDVLATRMGVLKRDGFTCGYCGSAASTIDHIHPQSKGGEDTWTNLISCCQPCNSKKADKSLSESGMKLLWEPKAPAKIDSFAKEQERVWKLIEQESGITA